MDFVQGVPKAGMLINVFSYFLRPYVLFLFFSMFIRRFIRFVGPYISPLPRYEREATEVIGDLLRQRIAAYEKYGKGWEMKPVRALFLRMRIVVFKSGYEQKDMITWFLEEAEPYQRDPTHIAMRLLRVNFAGLMSTSFVCSSLPPTDPRVTRFMLKVFTANPFQIGYVS